MPATPQRSIVLRRTSPGEAAALTALACAAKAHWGYPEAWIEAWRDELTVTPAYVAAHSVYVAQVEGRTAGFGAVVIRDGEATVDHLWVEPAAMRRGVGRALFGRLEELAREAGAERLRVVSDPHAEAFYRRMGAERRGLVPAPMDGQPRDLPVMVKEL